MLPHAPSLFDWLAVLAAIFFSPVFAVLAQRYIDRLREKKDRRVQCYLTLMSLRANPVHPDHVRALNSIDTIFDGKGAREQRIRDAWTTVLDHLNTSTENAGWHERFADARTDLYQAVGKAVGYDHSVNYIKTRVYNPQHYLDIEKDQESIRRGLANALSTGQLKVSLAAEEEPPGQAAAANN
jgi:hypothetical protein